MCVGIVFAVAYHILAVGSFCSSYHFYFTVESELPLSVILVDSAIFKKLQ
jgi:hypothetical protein